MDWFLIFVNMGNVDVMDDIVMYLLYKDIDEVCF